MTTQDGHHMSGTLSELLLVYYCYYYPNGHYTGNDNNHNHIHVRFVFEPSCFHEQKSAHDFGIQFCEVSQNGR